MKQFLIVFVLLTLCTVTVSAQITSAASGNWNATATWVGGVVPTATDNVVIANGHSVTVNTNVTVASVTVGQGASGTLTFTNAASDTVTITGNLTIASGASFVVPSQITTTGNTTALSATIAGVASTAGLINGMNISGIGIPSGTTIAAFDATTITLSLPSTATGTAVALTIGFNHALSLGGNLTNNGTLDLSLGMSAGVCNVTFNNQAGNQTVSGSGTMTRCGQITVDKGAMANKVSSTINVSSSTIAYVFGTWEQTAGRVNTSGTVNIGSATDTACALNIINSGSAAILSNINVFGKLLVNTTDSVLVGAGTQKIDVTNGGKGSEAIFTSGTVMVYGKIASNSLSVLTVNGANIIVDPKGFATAAPAGTDYAFRTTTGGGTNPFTFTGGTITILNPNSTPGANPEINLNSSIPPVVSGTATFILGDGSNTVSSTAGYRLSMQNGTSLNHLIVNTGTVGVALLKNLVLNGTLTITSCGALSGTGLTWTAPRYVFDGDVAQVTGAIMPATVNTVVIDNPAGVTSSQSLTITDTLYLLSGTLSGPYTANVTVTNVAPAAPVHLVAYDSSSTKVGIRWRQNTERDFLRYRIYRGTSPAPTAKVDSTTGGIADTSKLFTGLTNGTTYYFRVTAVDSAGLESPYSNEVSATPSAVAPVNVAPAASVNLVVFDTSSTKIGIKWQKNTESDFLRYRIYRGTSTSPTTKVDSTTGGIADTSKLFTGLTNGTKYYLRVTAVDSAGLESPYSNEVSATPGTAVSVEKVLDKTPTEYALSQNYPNPFNPTTRITFALAKRGNTTLKVYDLLGKEVAVLVNGFYEAGTFTATWNASEFTSGTYFFILKSGGYVETKKMILMK